MISGFKARRDSISLIMSLTLAPYFDRQLLPQGLASCHSAVHQPWAQCVIQVTIKVPAAFFIYLPEMLINKLASQKGRQTSFSSEGGMSSAYI